jgi:Tfp pilus assembly protein PilW
MLTRRDLAGRQRGMSLVELLVGVTVGLFVVAAAALLVGNQLSSNRRLLSETQLHQDMRATADIVTRELRRAGSDEITAVSFVWPKKAEQKFELQDLVHSSPTGIEFRYYRSLVTSGPFGFQLPPASSSLRSKMTSGQAATATTWQELTDPRVLKVTGFTVTDQSTPETIVPCPDLCADDSTDCWPRLQVREFDVAIAGEAVNDANVQRAMTTTVRIRNDRVRFADAANPNLVCPKPL